MLADYRWRSPLVVFLAWFICFGASCPLRAIETDATKGEEIRADLRSDPTVSSAAIDAEKKAFPLFVFIPGILGSAIDVRQKGSGDWTPIWPNSENQWQPLWSWIKRQINWILGSKPEASSLEYAEGQETRPRTLHDVSRLGITRDAYGEALLYIYSQSFEGFPVLEVFPYDWRQDIALTATKLNAWLCDTVAANPGRQITFIAHSMGGLVLRRWFRDFYQGNACGITKETIRSAIFLGTPHLGSPKVLRAFGDGFRLALEDGTLFGSLFGNFDKSLIAQDLNSAGYSFQSVYELLPIYTDRSCVDEATAETLKSLDFPVKIRSAGREHTRFEMFKAKAWRDLGWPKYMPTTIKEDEFYEKYLPEKLQKAHDFLCEMAKFRMPKEIRATYFYGMGDGRDTESEYIISPSGGVGQTRGVSELTRGDVLVEGDGTVPADIAKHSIENSMDNRRRARSKHDRLPMSEEFREYIEGEVEDSQRYYTVTLSQEKETSGAVFDAYRKAGAFAALDSSGVAPGNEVLSKLNKELLPHFGTLESLAASAEEVADQRQKANSLVVIADLAGSDPQYGKIQNRALVALGVLAAPATASDSVVKCIADDNNWCMQQHDYSATRYTELDQIQTKNVGSPKVAWTFSTGVLRGHEDSPLVIGSTMYVHTPFPNILYALNLDDENKIIWKYEPKQDPSVIPSDKVARGLQYADGKILFYQADTTLVALDAQTGKEVWKVVDGAPAKGETAVQTPLVINEKVIVGTSGGEFGVRTHVTAYNIADGKRLWRGYSMGPDDEILFDPEKTTSLGNPVGKDSSLKIWTGDQWKLGGGPTWGWYAWDPKLNLIYQTTDGTELNPTRKTRQDGKQIDQKPSGSIIARDPNTGVAVWAYQTQSPDESRSQGAGVDGLLIVNGMNVAGSKRDVLVHYDRKGLAYTIDRKSGIPLAAEKLDLGTTGADIGASERNGAARGSK